jgi:hypothetical protein
MRKLPIGPFLFLALLSLGLAACASKGAGAGAEMSEGAEASGDQISVEINNDLLPGRTVVVWMVPQTGSRRRLGSVPPNARRSFQYPPLARSTDHVLVAEIDGGGRETSMPFTLVGVSALSWNVSNPTVRAER